MKQNHLPVALENYLDKHLSSSVFTWRQIVNLTIPSILDTLSISFINMLTTALISQNGESSVAAVSLVSSIVGLVVCVFQGFSEGGSVIVAQSSGKGSHDLLSRSVSMTLWMTVLTGCTLCLPFLLLPHQILIGLYPNSEVLVLEKARIYLVGYAWSIIPFSLYIAISRVLRGLGENRKSLVLTIIINVGYLLLSILFLNVLKMDILGSVLALFFARLVGAIAAVVALFIWKPPVKLKLMQLFSFDRQILLSTTRVSIPFSVEQICINCGTLVSQMYMTALGTAAIATHAIATSLLGLLYSPALSVSNLAITVVGRCIGAEKKDSAYRYGRICNQITLLLLITAALIFYPLLSLLLKQYNPSAETEHMVRMLLYATLPCLLLFWPMSSTLPATLRSASDAVYPTVASLSILWIVNIGLGYVLAIHAGLGLWGVWIATWSAWAIRSALFYWRFRSQKWLNKSSLNTAGQN